MAGFLSPSILFLSTWGLAERQFMGALSAKLLERGYTRIVEPCAGGFAMPAAHVQAGWKPSQMECSDVSLYTAIVGHAVTGQDHAALDVRVDGKKVRLGKDPIRNGAKLLYTQLDLRMAMKPDNAYWNEIRKDLAWRRDEHLAGLVERLELSRDLMAGMSFAPRDLWEHMRSVADDPKTVISINPPTYVGGFEKFYDTGGRLTWDEPEYELFDAEVHQYDLAEEARSWDALLLCQQQQEPGKGCRDVVHARDLSRGQVVYVWSNRGREVEELLGRSARARGGESVRPPEPLIPFDHEVTAESKVAVRRLGNDEARYVKDLWMHKVDSSTAVWQVGVLIDGYLAGIIGLNAPTLATWQQQAGDLLMTFATAGPHKARLTRLVTALALSRPIMRQFIDTWTLATAGFVKTAELTRHPEIKGLRGLMKLEERKKDPAYGYRLIYKSPIRDWTADEALKAWLRKEEQWEQQRQRQRQKASK